MFYHSWPYWLQWVFCIFFWYVASLPVCYAIAKILDKDYGIDDSRFPRHILFVPAAPVVVVATTGFALFFLTNLFGKLLYLLIIILPKGAWQLIKDIRELRRLVVQEREERENQKNDYGEGHNNKY